MDPQELTDDVSADMPRARPEVIADAAARAAQDATPTDAGGATFDPTVHMADASGSPILTKNGHLRRKPGRKKGSAAPRSSTPPPPDQVLRERAESERYRTTAQVTVDSIVGLSVMTAGEHWTPEPAHRGAMVDAWTDYYRVRGIRDLPPEITIAVVMGAWALGTSERRADISRAVKSARSNLWNNGNRKDTPSDANS